MKGFLSILPAAGLAAALATAAGAQPTGPRAILFEQPNFQGASITVVDGSPDLSTRGFAERAMSGRFEGDWTLCDLPGLDGRCASVSGEVADLGTVGLNRRVVSLREARAAADYSRSDRYGNEDARDGEEARNAATDPDDERVPGPHAMQAEAPAPPTSAAFAATPPVPAASPAPPPVRYAAPPPPAATAPPPAVVAARNDNDAGRSAVFFAHPQRGGSDVAVDVQGPANQFCRDQGLGPAVYYDTDGRELRDVLCRRN